MKHIRKSIILDLTIIFVFLALFISCPKTLYIGDDECDCIDWKFVMEDYFSGNTGDTPDFTKWVNDCTNDSTADIQNNSLAFYGGSNQFEHGTLAVKNFPFNSKALDISVSVSYDLSSDFFISFIDTSDDDQYTISFSGSYITLSAFDSSKNILADWIGSYEFDSVDSYENDWYNIHFGINTTQIVAQVHNDSSNGQGQKINHPISSDLPLNEIDKIIIGGGEDEGGSRKTYFDYFRLSKM